MTGEDDRTTETPADPAGPAPRPSPASPTAAPAASMTPQPPQPPQPQPLPAPDAPGYPGWVYPRSAPGDAAGWSGAGPTWGWPPTPPPGSATARTVAAAGRSGATTPASTDSASGTPVPTMPPPWTPAGGPHPSTPPPSWPPAAPLAPPPPGWPPTMPLAAAPTAPPSWQPTVPGAGWFVPVWAPRPGPAPGLVWADYPVRFGAFLLDVGVIVLAEIAASFIGVALSGPVAPPAVDAGRAEPSPIMIAISVAWFLFVIAYFPAMWRLRGATLGQATLGLRVVRGFDGGPLDIGTAITRAVGFWETLVSGLLAIGFILVPLAARGEARKRMWPDHLADTVVVKRGW